jgi:hypothetical protein
VFFKDENLGFSVKFNWVLQADIPQELQLGKCYEFSKEGNRVFPIETPIDLIDSSRAAIAKIRVKTFNNSVNTTDVTFEVIKLYSGDEKSVLTKYWVENGN